MPIFWDGKTIRRFWAFGGQKPNVHWLDQTAGDVFQIPRAGIHIAADDLTAYETPDYETDVYEPGEAYDIDDFDPADTSPIVGDSTWVTLDAGKFVPHTARLLHFVAILRSTDPDVGASAWLRSMGSTASIFLGRVGITDGNILSGMSVTHARIIVSSAGKMPMQANFKALVNPGATLEIHAQGFSVMEAL